ncbi:hypothetical protein IAD21_03625 [Abditibacteriota bacterium]|nr:hypothetical protein IAD21_03625 [Abditibacteriota bacterium]
MPCLRSVLRATPVLFGMVSPLAAHAQPTTPFSFAAPSLADPAASALCIDGECQPVITDTTYLGRPAFRLTDGKSEAVIVPSLGRVMRYGKVGGPNLLWNAPAKQDFKSGWKNYGGDKTWLSPQSDWGVLSDKTWPPDTSFDGSPHQAEVITGGKLKLVSGTSKTSGIRVERVMSFNAAGEFEIQQSAIKTSGTPVRVGLWSVSQSVPAQAVFALTSPDSPYRNGYFHFDTKEKQQPAFVENGVFRLEPKSEGGGQKFGIDAPVAALASVQDGVAWVQKSAKPDGQYPDGVEKHGFPVEVYVNGSPGAYYVELEMLGPLVNMVKGQKMTHTVRWSLHALPSHDLSDPATQNAIAALLQ